MDSKDESIPVRKAFSAENPKDVNELGSTYNLSENLRNKLAISCASASYVSNRRKNIQERHLDNLLSEDFTSKYLKQDFKENQKLFLGASQVLEKLNKVISKFSGASQLDEISETSSPKSKATLREIVLYQDVLKRLLEERCTLVLKEECDLCIKRTLKLINDFRHLYMSEKLKMMTMPIQASNRFVSSNDISISTLELLIKKLQAICDLHSSISSSYQKIINCFHVGLDLELYQMVSKTNKILSTHKCNLFYWAYKSVTVLMQKLCLADPNSVSPDFLQSILGSCEIFNALLKNNKSSSHCCIKSFDLFSDHILNFEYKELPFSLILNYLAFFEAKIASEKIIHFLTSTCKKSQQADLKKKVYHNNDTVQNNDSSTSDYCSASVSDLDSEKSIVKIHQFTDVNVNFANVLIAITQRNQSLILKYLYAISNLQNSSNKIKRRASCESNSVIFPIRPVWDAPDKNIRSKNNTFLEEFYWNKFWNNAKRLIFKILFEVPYHQYGDSGAGTIILWPDNYLNILSDCLKSSLMNNDITDEGKYIIKQIYEFILVHKIHTSWDKEFSVALSTAHSHHCIPVLTASNHIKTLPGNHLNTCIDILVDIFNVEFHDIDLFLFLQCLHQLQSTLDCFILWVNNKSRSSLASQNLPTYLLISWSDCKSSLELLESRTTVMAENADTFARISALKLGREKIIIKQTDILKGYKNEATDLVYKVCFSTLRDSLLFTLKYEHSLKKCSIFRSKTFILDTQEELIFPLTEIINNLPDISPILKAISASFAQSFLTVLYHLNSISAKHIKFLNTEYSKFIQWLDKLDLAEDKKIEIKHVHSLQKLEAVLKYIQNASSEPRAFFKQRNRVMPTSEMGKFVEGVNAGFVGDELEETAEEIPGGFVEDDNTGFIEEGLTGFVEDDLALDIVEYCNNLFEMTIIVVGLLNHTTFFDLHNIGYAVIAFEKQP
ncbi:hypothetical protein CDAR_546901 [Caerostris darwini]|uniref:Coiled-coil protein 142 C-terminal domain-containing protein n=1 Tax=Caerostris darwini TaxID=1538125 RepID=A0AAV4WAE9_9ARAC|nr:hypothetical protein CDAR_546901 [Caerostris darwini]